MGDAPDVVGRGRRGVEVLMRRRWTSWTLWVAIAILSTLSACGDALVDTNYRGTSLLTFEGQVRYATSHFPKREYNIRLSVFWSPEGPKSDKDRMVEQPSASILIDFPSAFQISLYQPPESKHFMIDHPKVAIGRIMLYDERDNEKGYKKKKDDFVGGAVSKGIVYASEFVPAGESGLGLALEPGFHLVNLPMNCGEVDGPTPEPSDCGKTLGDPCTVQTAESDCGPAALCIPDGDSPYHLPGGYCVVDHAAQDCNPKNGRLLEWYIDGEHKQLYFQACSDQSMCRQGEGYVCDSFHLACLPDPLVQLELDPFFTPAMLCVVPPVMSE
jgi:hypothetical protein